MIDPRQHTTIGSAEIIRFPDLDNQIVTARIDSGARTSSIWGKATVDDQGQLRVVFFGQDTVYTFGDYSKMVVASSTGHTETRYTIKLVVRIAGRRIKATFTIANRSTQVYPVLIGRNVLRGKFIIDVKQGTPLKQRERARVADLQRLLHEDKELEP